MLGRALGDDRGGEGGKVACGQRTHFVMVGRIGLMLVR